MDCIVHGVAETDRTKRLSCVTEYAKAECLWKRSYHIKCYEGGLRQGWGRRGDDRPSVATFAHSFNKHFTK